MSDITWAMVETITSDTSLASVPVDAQTEILGYVNTQIGGASFSTYDLKLARIWYAAHVGSGCVPGVSGTGGGAVTSESGGDGLSVSYSVSTQATDDELGETAYGRRYLAMVRTSCAGPVLL
jgi:hypothetical protein